MGRGRKVMRIVKKVVGGGCPTLAEKSAVTGERRLFGARKRPFNKGGGASWPISNGEGTEKGQ